MTDAGSQAALSVAIVAGMVTDCSRLEARRIGVVAIVGGSVCLKLNGWRPACWRVVVGVMVMVCFLVLV